MKRKFFLLSCLANRSLTGHGPNLRPLRIGEEKKEEEEEQQQQITA